MGDGDAYVTPETTAPLQQAAGQVSTSAPLLLPPPPHTHPHPVSTGRMGVFNMKMYSVYSAVWYTFVP